MSQRNSDSVPEKSSSLPGLNKSRGLVGCGCPKSANPCSSLPALKRSLRSGMWGGGGAVAIAT